MSRRTASKAARVRSMHRRALAQLDTFAVELAALRVVDSMTAGNAGWVPWHSYAYGFWHRDQGGLIFHMPRASSPVHVAGLRCVSAPPGLVLARILVGVQDLGISAPLDAARRFPLRLGFRVRWPEQFLTLHIERARDSMGESSERQEGPIQLHLVGVRREAE